MAFAPATPQPSKLRLFSVPAPNYKDFNGPPDGDYVRYVEGLMAWAEQEQERQRLQLLGDKARAQTQTDSQWGRTPAISRASAQRAQSVDSMAQSGGVESKLERLRRKAAAQASKLQTQMPQPKNDSKKPPAKISFFMVVAIFAGFVLVGSFAPALLPVAIIGWVAFNVIRAVRGAASSSKS